MAYYPHMEPLTGLTQAELIRQRQDAFQAVRGSMTEEDIERALTPLERSKDPENLERKKIEQAAREAQEITRIERTNDEITRAFAVDLMIDLIRTGSGKEKQVNSQEYLDALNRNYAHLTQLITDRYGNAPDINVNGIALVIFANALDEFRKSQALETAKELFIAAHHDDTLSPEEEKEQSARISQTNIISTPFASEASFNLSEIKEPVETSPAMFRLEDLQKQQPKKKADDIQTAA